MDRTDLLCLITIGVPFILFLTGFVLRLAYLAHPILFIAAIGFLAINITHYTRKALAP